MMISKPLRLISLAIALHATLVSGWAQTSQAAAPAKAYLIADIDVSDLPMYQTYIPLSAAAVAKYGGKFLVRGGQPKALEGPRQPSRIVVLEFGSMADLQAFYDSPEYLKARAIRQKASTTPLYVVVQGTAP